YHVSWRCCFRHPILHIMEKLPEFIGNHLFLASLFIAILILLLWNLFGTALAGVTRVPPSEVTRLMNREKAVIVDVRGSGDFSSGHILNAMNIPESELATRLKELEKFRKQPVIT